MITFLGTYLEPVSYSIYLVAFSIKFASDRQSKRLLLILYYLIASLLMVYASSLSLLPQDDSKNWNGYLYNILFFLTCPVITIFFTSLLRSIVFRTILHLLSICVMVAFYIALVAGKERDLNSFTAALSFFVAIVGCFLYFIQLLKTVNDKNILSNFEFWTVSGFLLYFLGNFFIILGWYALTVITNEPLTDEQAVQLAILWSVHNVLLFISAINLLIVSVWMSFRKGWQLSK